jgi:hypothetical protein
MNQLMALLFQDASQSPSPAAAGMGIGIMIVYLVILVVMIAAMWKVFEKAGEPGWAAIVPIYNWIVLLKIAGKPWWWFLILWLFIPWIIAAIALAKNFGKGTGFGLGIAFLGFIFIPILAFSDAKYQPVAT